MQESAAPYVTLRPENFQTTIDGQPVDLYTIRNNAGMVVRITNYGARIQQILVPDRAGRLGDVVQGYDSIAQVLSGQPSMGAFIGRFANRIASGRFTLDGQMYQLAVNNGPNSLHGGAKGSRFRVFEARQLSDRQVEMTYVFADGEENYPGTLPLRVVYGVNDDNALVIDFTSVAVDRATIANFTSHGFFNLSGQGDRSILDHMLMIDAEAVLDIDDHATPTGSLREVAGTPLDFRAPTEIGARINEDDPLLRKVGGYDHAYVLPTNVAGGGSNPSRPVATVFHPLTGRVMEVLSTEPSLQFFSGNSLTGEAPRDRGKGGVLYGPRSGFCLEPQRYPDAPNHAQFPSTVMRPGEWRTGHIVYRFSTRPADFMLPAARS